MRTLYVSINEKQWRVHWQDQRTGPVFVLRSSAIKAAINIVAKLPEGECLQIKAQDSHGEYKTIWLYSTDKFPPKLPVKNSAPNNA